MQFGLSWEVRSVAIEIVESVTETVKAQTSLQLLTGSKERKRQLFQFPTLHTSNQSLQDVMIL